MNKLNVFNQSYSPWKYPSNWIRNIRLFGRQFKWAYQRIVRGYCDYDVWDLDTYYLDLFYETLNHLADTTHGYPGNKEFPTPEAWDKYLRDMAMDFYKANEVNDYYSHPACDLWWESIKNKDITKTINTDNHYSSAMIAEANKNEEKRIQDMENGLEKMKAVFFHLWD